MNKKYGVLNQIARIRSVPNEGEVGTIIRNDGFVLGLFNDDTAVGTKVVFETRDQAATGQLWTPGTADRDGYYHLGNKKSRQFLTCSSSTKINIAGNPITLKYLIHIRGSTKEVQIVYRLFLVHCYLLHVPRLPSQPASSGRG